MPDVGLWACFQVPRRYLSLTLCGVNLHITPWGAGLAGQWINGWCDFLTEDIFVTIDDHCWLNEWNVKSGELIRTSELESLETLSRSDCRFIQSLGSVILARCSSGSLSGVVAPIRYNAVVGITQDTVSLLDWSQHRLSVIGQNGVPIAALAFRKGNALELCRFSSPESQIIEIEGLNDQYSVAFTDTVRITASCESKDTAFRIDAILRRGQDDIDSFELVSIDIQAGVVEWLATLPVSAFARLKLSSDGMTLACIDESGSRHNDFVGLVVYRVQDQRKCLSSISVSDRIELTFKTRHGQLVDWCVSENGRHIAILWSDGTVFVIHTKDGSFFWESSTPEDLDSSGDYFVRLSPSGHTVAFVGKRLWVIRVFNDRHEEI